MIKSDLRKLYKKKRGELSPSEVIEYSNQIVEQIVEQFELKGKAIHVFIPIEKFNEVKTGKLVEFLFKNNCTAATSITHFNPLSLSHCIIDRDTQYAIDKFGIPTPINCKAISEDKLDVVIIPLLAFDKEAGRVGYGKGLYDQFLSKCDSKCVKIGVSFFEPITKIDDLTNDDIKLDYCVTPNSIFNF